MNLWTALGIGFILGLRHASDADHVVAVSTIVARNKKWGTAWLLGAFWGVGHTLTLLAVGTAIIFFHVLIPPRLGLSMELAVGTVLVALGLYNLSGRKLGASGLTRHSHPHESGAAHHGLVAPDSPDGKIHEHEHWHVNEPGWFSRLSSRGGRFQLGRSLAVGLVHGLAGSAAVALLVLATIPTAKAGILYLLVFGIGTLVGMLALSSLMELGVLYFVNFWEKAQDYVTVGTGAFSVLFGCWIVWKIGVVDGLLTGHPHWVPE